MKRNTIQKTIAKRMTRGWKGYCGQVLIFIGACLLLNRFQEMMEQGDASISQWGVVPERDDECT